ncbi:MAG: RNA methyltransferase [Erysipelotrichaceae bacterium]|nr:RNA methyltransferase [Erysipelotrichaceae bacterium]MDP3306564.1 RNA methyltransferase [Erysipelotrichaceae bacterium]
MEIITSLQNNKVKQWVKYQLKKHRDEDGVFLAVGDHLVKEAQMAGILREVMISAPVDFDVLVPKTEVSPEICRKISMTQSGVNIVGLCEYPRKHQSAYQRWLLCDDIQDPGNMGTIIRTALSFGFDAVAVSDGSADVFNDKTLRASQGAVFHLPIIRSDLKDIIKELKENGVVILASTLDDAQSLDSFEPLDQVAVILGNEGQGVSNRLLALADNKVKIEMSGFDSLNVAVAAGIFCYHWRR